MPSPVATAGGTAQTTQTNAGTPRAAALIPFRRATREHMEVVTSYAQQLTANPQNPPGGVVSIPAYGYLRGIWIKLTCAGGAGAATYQEDGPWSALQNIILSEPNGAPIYQFSTGYHIYMAGKFGGYFNQSELELANYAASTANGNFTVYYYLPLELNERDALGSLPNQNAAAMFQLRFQLAGLATIYSSNPATTIPTVTVEVHVDEWDQPQATTDNAANQTTPPAMNTTQFWSEQQFPIVAGNNRIRLTRVGNYIRELLFLFRTTAAGTRAAGDTNWPSLTEIDLDARPMTFLDKNLWRTKLYTRTGFSAGAVLALDAAGAQDAGVFVYDFAHEFDGRIGHENRDAWLKTYGSSRLEIVGSFGAAGTLTVLTNDVAIASNVFLG